MFSVSIEQSPPHNNIGDLGRGVEGAGIPHKLYEIPYKQGKELSLYSPNGLFLALMHIPSVLDMSFRK